MISIIETSAWAMGNAYLCKFENMGDTVFLAENGEIGIRKQLRQKGLYPITVQYVHNVEADRMQRNGVPFFEIIEE